MAKLTSSTKRGEELTDLIQQFLTYASATRELKCYRGQKDASWRPIAGLFRPGMERLAANERKAIRDLISVHPQEFERDQSMLDKLVRMQHFGLPTRLLDVSMNALVALFFATERGKEGTEDGVVLGFSIPTEREKYFDSDSVSCLANLANMTGREKKDISSHRALIPATLKGKERVEWFNSNDSLKRLHYFIQAEKSHFLPAIKPIDLFKPYFVHAKMSNRRILAQAGAFIIYGIDPPQKLKFAHPISPKRFMVPAGCKDIIRKALQSLGINESTLFPELDKAAERIKKKYTG